MCHVEIWFSRMIYREPDPWLGELDWILENPIVGLSVILSGIVGVQVFSDLIHPPALRSYHTPHPDRVEFIE